MHSTPLKADPCPVKLHFSACIVAYKLQMHGMICRTGLTDVKMAYAFCKKYKARSKARRDGAPEQQNRIQRLQLSAEHRLRISASTVYVFLM